MFVWGFVINYVKLCKCKKMPVHIGWPWLLGVSSHHLTSHFGLHLQKRLQSSCRTIISSVFEEFHSCTYEYIYIYTYIFLYTPLVNVYITCITMERFTMLSMGKLTISMAMFGSKLLFTKGYLQHNLWYLKMMWYQSTLSSTRMTYGAVHLTDMELLACVESEAPR